MDVEAFIDRWSTARGGAERANYQMFLSELCEALELPRPDPASDDTRTNDYVFERGVKRRESEGAAATLRIDLYKRGCFILEAKQSRASQRDDGQQSLFKADETASTAATEGRWDVLMRNARRQAEDYAFRLPADHPAPPFIIVCDVGYVFEVYADFSGSGRAYGHFPDRKGFRIRLEDLRRPEIAERLKAIWTDPQSLDPSRHAARVTRQIAERLAAVSRRLERNHPPEEVAHFLMRCIFTMFAEDVDLLPKGRFTQLLKDQLEHPDSFAPMLQALWRSMDAPDYDNRFYAGFGLHLKHFNGSLFKDARAFPMTKEEIGELLAASSHDWRYVEPAIFGTLVEQALDPAERRQLGAHYTPRSYVERLVEVTIMEPLRTDWNAAQIKAGDARERGDGAEAVAAIRAFHHQLCATRVLDPACGTGNFLYVSLELMKRLEGEVLEALAELGETETIGLEEVDPHQFLGIELNVRAAAIAELVLWIGYLQQHYRNRSEHPAEPILKAFGNIQQKDAVLTWDGYPELQFEMVDGVAVQVFPNARRPTWPAAEFIVGNPPFIGSKRLKSYLTEEYVSALRKAEPDVPKSVDYVLYWWNRAAQLVQKGKTRRAGLVSTNSITQFYNRRLLAAYLGSKTPVSLVWAIPDHPWMDVEGAARVRVSLGCIERGEKPGVVELVSSERWADESEAIVELDREHGSVNEKFQIGFSIYRTSPMQANVGVCWQGVKLVGDGFRLDRSQKDLLLQRDPDCADLVRPYITGMSVNRVRPAEWVIDLFGMTDDEARKSAPHLYQHLLEHVRSDRLKNADEGFRTKWWLFGRPRPEMRDAVAGGERYLVTSEVSKHRFFVAVDDPMVLADGGLIVIALSAAWQLSVLSSGIHVAWTLWGAGMLEDRPRYQNQLSFDPFPFPDPDEATRATLRTLGEELDATRKTVQAEHPDLTLTGLYNVLEKVRAGAALSEAETDVKARGRVLILKDLHDQIDAATADAYGWPRDLTDEQILERLVALNAERAKEEAAGHVRWLRPDYQIPRFAKGAKARTGELDLGEGVVVLDKGLPAFPKDKGEQVMAIRAVLQAAAAPMDAAAVARAFKGGGKKIEQRVAQALATLVRYAEISALPDGRFAARRAA